jgi:Spy/CpxP family protein refolding chaperone
MILSSLLFVVGLATSPAHAEDHGASCPMMAPDMGLTDAQKAQMADIHFRASTARIAIKARVATARLEIEHDFTSPTLDEKAINKAVDALNAASAELRKNAVDEMIACRKVLTPEQAAHAAAMPCRDCAGDEEHGRRGGDDEEDGGERRGKGHHEGEGHGERK